MTALGTITTRPVLEKIPTRIPISAYTVVRGNYLGTITTHAALDRIPLRTNAVSDYVVRQLSIIYRQLWPSHGQRFPQ